MGRSSRPDVFCEKSVFRNFEVSFLTMLQAEGQVFPCEFRKISKNTFSYRIPPVAASGWVVLWF